MPDGALAIGRYQSTGELWVLPLNEGSRGAAKPQAFLDSRSRKNGPAFSPDGHWVAYESIESGVREIYVVPYPGPGPKILISTQGGALPRWSHNGLELFYRTENTNNQDVNFMMVVDVETSRHFARDGESAVRGKRLCERLRRLTRRKALSDGQGAGSAAVRLAR